MTDRIEKDSLGEVRVPQDALFGAQTQRALENFQISHLKLPQEFVRSLVLVKKAAASANERLGQLSPEIARSIKEAADTLLNGAHQDQFSIDVFQTGSGTSSNMNVNEVIARLASASSGIGVHPNDHVNLGQSSNDVIPTTIHVSTALALQQNLPALTHLRDTITRKAATTQGLVKTGRTHLMDALPMSLSQEMSGWAGQIDSGIERLLSCQGRLYALPQGGTAIGTGLNAHPDFAETFIREITRLTGIQFRTAGNFFQSISSQDTAVEVSGHLKSLAVSLMKISNDLRWMNSGPLAGLAEIELPILQPGSSIMPGKVNPVIAEAVAMVAAQVIGNDTSITVAGQSGNFQLNVMLPLIAHNLLQSVQILAKASEHLADKAISGFKVNKENIERALVRNPVLATALNPLIGYDRAAAIAKQAYREKRPLIDVAEELTDIPRSELERLLAPQLLADGGLPVR